MYMRATHRVGGVCVCGEVKERKRRDDGGFNSIMAHRRKKAEASRRRDVDVDKGKKEGGDAEKKAIFLCTDRAPEEGKREHVWYQWDFRLRKKKSRSRYVMTFGDRAPPPLPQVDSKDCSFISLGSVIYVLGGSCLPGCGRPHNCCRRGSVSFYDTSMSSTMRSWTQGPHMLCPRAAPAAATLDGKIYVFGASPAPHFGLPPSDHRDLFGEVFDPALQAWKPLPDPPKKLFNGTRYAQSYNFATVGCRTNGKNLILVHCIFDKELYAYDVDHESWTVVDDNYGVVRGTMVVVDDVLYTVGAVPCLPGNQGLCAYDLVRNEFLSIKHHNPDLWIHQNCTLLDMGNGVLALADFGRAYLLSNYVSLFYVFRVVKVPPKSDPHADPTIRLCFEDDFFWPLPDDSGGYLEGYISANVLE